MWGTALLALPQLSPEGEKHANKLLQELKTGLVLLIVSFQNLACVTVLFSWVFTSKQCKRPCKMKRFCEANASRWYWYSMGSCFAECQLTLAYFHFQKQRRKLTLRIRLFHIGSTADNCCLIAFVQFAVLPGFLQLYSKGKKILETKWNENLQNEKLPCFWWQNIRVLIFPN